MNNETIQADLGHVIDSTVTTIEENYALKTLNEKGMVILEDVKAVGATARQLLTEGAEDFIPEFADVQVDVPEQEVLPEAIPEELPQELPPVDQSQLDIAYEDLEGVEFSTADGAIFVLQDGVLVPAEAEATGTDVPMDEILAEEVPAEVPAEEVPADITNVSEPVVNPEDVAEVPEEVVPAEEVPAEEDPEDKTKKLEESTVVADAAVLNDGEAGDEVPASQVLAESTGIAENTETKVITESGISSYLSNMITQLEGGQK